MLNRRRIISDLNIYRFPEIYLTLLPYDTELWDEVQSWLPEYMDGPCERVMDPACGPASWILPFAKQGKFVAGNDLEPMMIEEAQKQLAGYPSELLVGDMCDLQLQGPFDLAINFESSIGHLPDHDAAARHFRSVHGLLREGGVYLIGVMVLDGDEPDESIEELYESQCLLLPSGGSAKVSYQSLFRDPLICSERISFLVETEKVPNCPEKIMGHYDLLTFPKAKVRELIEDTGFELVAVRSADGYGYFAMELDYNCGDIILVLRKKSGEA